MATRLDVISPAVLVGFIAFCVTLDPLLFVAWALGSLGALTVLAAWIGSRSKLARADAGDLASAYPAE
jgi:hypothetical protein